MKKKHVLKPIMFVGTSSDVGKSVITAGFCRIFKQDGFYPAPFKAQNMSLNSFATPEGLEIGRAQAVQAEAAGVPCHTDMNPLLLKPTSDSSSQLVLHGKVAGNMSARDYLKTKGREKLFTEAAASFSRLSSKYNPIVMEGAGSISELNLKHLDISNLKMAQEAGAATFLVADIERGGVFASLYGTIALLEPEEKTLIKGIIINKFRGDSSLFDEGRTMIEKLCGVPVVGVLPYFKDITIDEEDSVSLKQKVNKAVENKVNIAVILLNYLSNFTDFSRLENDPRVNLYYTRDVEEIAKADIIILPGSKNTIEDTIAIKNSSLSEAITTAFKNGKTLIGICGGYQIMGESIEDPNQVESVMGSTSGLGILPVKTILQKEKVTQQCSFRFRDFASECTGYEIHMGETVTKGHSPLNYFNDGRTEGYFLNERCWGTYIHGILDNPTVINYLISAYTESHGNISDHAEFKNQQYDKLADLIRQHLDLDYIYQILQS